MLTIDCEWLSLKATDMKLIRERGGDNYGTSSKPGRISIANFLTKLAGVFITSEDPATNDIRLLCAGSTLHARFKVAAGTNNTTLSVHVREVDVQMTILR